MKNPTDLSNLDTIKVETRTLLIWSFIAALIILSLWGASGFFIYWLYPKNDDHGTFGDMFGAVNALFSGWAFLGVVVAIILQKYELEAQRTEIMHARHANEQSAKALEGQLAAARFTTQIEALNHVIDALSSRIRRTENARTLDERKQHDQLIRERDQYEDQLRRLVDEYLVTTNNSIEG